MRKTPYTMGELFQILKEKVSSSCDINQYQLDYQISGWSSDQTMKLRRENIWLNGVVEYGGSEGIYIDLSLYEDTGEKTEARGFATIKTLDESDESLYRMAELMIRYKLALKELIRENEEDFRWEGFSVYPVVDDKPLLAYFAATTSRISDVMGRCAKNGVTRFRVVCHGTKEEAFCCLKDGEPVWDDWKPLKQEDAE